jgi:hypothetical protein
LTATTNLFWKQHGQICNHSLSLQLVTEFWRWFVQQRQSSGRSFSRRSVPCSTPRSTMSLEPKKSGGPIQKFWDSQDIITSLEIVKGWLCKNAKKVGKKLERNKFSKKWDKNKEKLSVYVATAAA